MKERQTRPIIVLLEAMRSPAFTQQLRRAGYVAIYVPTLGDMESVKIAHPVVIPYGVPTDLAAATLAVVANLERSRSYYGHDLWELVARHLLKAVKP
jgi:hypothetical protein